MKTLEDLIKSGVLSIGEKLVWVRRSLGIKHVAILNQDGSITTADGKVHRSPSGAAKHLNNSKPVDGWIAWKVEKTKTSLSKYRE